MDGQKDNSISDQILAIIGEKPGLKARQIADRLSEDRKTVNDALYGRLKGKVRQDSQYRWHPVSAGAAVAHGRSEHGGSKTILAKLCGYYLDCLSQGGEDGVSVFASSRKNQDYLELRHLPGTENLESDPFDVDGLDGLLRSIKQARGRQAMYVGYPCRLRSHKARSGWEGYFLDPVLLWAVHIEDGVPVLSADVPAINFSVLRSLAVAGDSNYLEESAQLNEELGLDRGPQDSPEIDELVIRLRSIRPDWDWREQLDSDQLSSGAPMSAIGEEGIYNRAVLVTTERSKYTQGLETELKLLINLKEEEYAGTALDYWLHGGDIKSDQAKSEQAELIEVIPMNSEQRTAVEKGLTEPLSVITGPPGTGKSQVVMGLLTNAIWSGRKTLFASKNNKAVDVVYERVNGLARSPTLVRVGSGEKNVTLAEHLLAMLSTTVSSDDVSEFDSSRAVYARLNTDKRSLDALYDQVLNARNTVDELDRQVTGFRAKFGDQFVNDCEHIALDDAIHQLRILEISLRRADRSKQKGFARFAWSLLSGRREKALKTEWQRSEPVFASLGLSHSTNLESGISPEQLIADAQSRLDISKTIQNYGREKAELESLPAFEDLARRAGEMSTLVANNAEELWRQWVDLQPSRLSADSRRALGAYTTTLQAMLDSRGGDARAARQIAGRYYKLFPKIVDLMPCWSVTSLSARGKVPFERGFFDLLIVDEASQCDIASVLPLLFRAKRAVVIGDPMQLTHIAGLTPEKDQRLQTKHHIPESYAAWNYAVNSVFNLAVTIAEGGALTMLRDHYRSHADIIEFSNEFFYKGRLRVATSYGRLNVPMPDESAVFWTDVVGRVIRPANGGAVNEVEARSVVKAIESLIAGGYKGTIGAVTPFRAQANLIRRMILENPGLTDALLKAEFLVDTVHRFQGDEKDVMFFSPVASEGVTKGAISFLRSNGNLFNVAITRARALLHVVGDRSAALNSDVDYLSAFAGYVDVLTGDYTSRIQASVAVSREYPVIAHPERVSDWERVLYQALFEAGVRTIPQYDVEQYTLDFAIFDGDRQLNVEVDGERYHKDWTGELCRRDRMRNRRLIELGWDVRRFWVYQVRDDIDACVSWVKGWLSDSKAVKQGGQSTFSCKQVQPIDASPPTPD